MFCDPASVAAGLLTGVLAYWVLLGADESTNALARSYDHVGVRCDLRITTSLESLHSLLSHDARNRCEPHCCPMHASLDEVRVSHIDGAWETLVIDGTVSCQTLPFRFEYGHHSEKDYPAAVARWCCTVHSETFSLDRFESGNMRCESADRCELFLVERRSLWSLWPRLVRRLGTWLFWLACAAGVVAVAFGGFVCFMMTFCRNG